MRPLKVVTLIILVATFQACQEIPPLKKKTELAFTKKKAVIERQDLWITGDLFPHSRAENF